LPSRRRPGQAGRRRANELRALEGRLEAFLEELTAPLGRRDRRAWAGAYVRGAAAAMVSVRAPQPMAMRWGKSKQGLQQFVNQSPWPAAALLEGLVRRQARRPAPAYWIIDLEELSLRRASTRLASPASIAQPWASRPTARWPSACTEPEERAGARRPLSWRGSPCPRAGRREHRAVRTGGEPRRASFLPE
jgi:DDE superfamily endonuclease